MSKPVVTEREVRIARAFLHGIHANEMNTYLLLAAIAWMRAMGKAHDLYWKSLSRYGAQAAGQRLAAKLLSRATADKQHYKGVLAALRRTVSKGADLVAQARDFMLAIEQSSWDKHHYGYTPYVAGHWEVTHTYYGGGQPGPDTYTWVPEQPENDPMAQAWAKLTGHPIPPKWFVDTVTTHRTITIPPRPTQPRSLMHVLPKADYILPYAAQKFYTGRPHLGDSILPS